MKIKTNDLSGAALDWAVAKCEGGEWNTYPDASPTWYWPKTKAHAMRAPRYSSDWSQAGPIIERECISILRCDDDYGTDAKGFTTSRRIPVWAATRGQHSANGVYGPQGDNWGSVYSLDVSEVMYGPAPLVAAMRCYVASKLGEDVDVPVELAYL